MHLNLQQDRCQSIPLLDCTKEVSWQSDGPDLAAPSASNLLEVFGECFGFFVNSKSAHTKPHYA